MNPEAKTLLLDALRSGKYKQGQQALKQVAEWDENETLHCCLGVLCEIAVEKGVDLKVETPEEADYKRYYLFDGGYEVLPKVVAEWAGIGSIGQFKSLFKGVEFNDATYYALAELNDAGMTFDEIADVIEKEF